MSKADRRQEGEIKMRVSIKDIETFRGVFKTISPLIQDCDLVFDEDALRLTQMDKSKVVLVDLLVKEPFFEDYDVVKQEYIRIKMDHLKKVLGEVKGDQMLSIETSEEENLFHLTIHSVYDTIYDFPLLRRDYVYKKAFSAPHHVHITFTPDFLRTMVKRIEIISGIVTFEVDREGKIDISGRIEQNKALLPIDQSEESVIVDVDWRDEDENFPLKKGQKKPTISHPADDVAMRYSLRYLKQIMGIDAYANTMVLSIGNAMPMCLECQIGNYITARFLMAPYQPKRVKEGKEPKKTKGREKEKEDEK
jgi:hypothetical protein